MDDFVSSLSLALQECARLLPSCKLHITMCGRQISKSVDQYHWEKENLRISVCRALYHEADLPSPHIAVGVSYSSLSFVVKKYH